VRGDPPQRLVFCSGRVSRSKTFNCIYNSITNASSLAFMQGRKSYKPEVIMPFEKLFTAVAETRDIFMIKPEAIARQNA